MNWNDTGDQKSGIVDLRVDGKLDKSDYEKFVPLAEERIDSHGSINLLIRIEKLRGWSPSALWEDLKFDAKHYKDISRLAVVGKDDSQKWMAAVSKPFTAAEVKFFAENDLNTARRWVCAL